VKSLIGPALGLLFIVGTACAKGPAYGGPAAPLSEPTDLCSVAQRDRCRSVEDVERRLATADLELLGATGSPGGTQGAYVLTLRDRSDGTVLRAKWRAAEGGSLVNVPHRELGAYHVQKLVLEPRDFIIPPTVARCLPIEAYREHIDAEAVPTAGAECVLGFLTYWLEDAMSVDDVREEGLLEAGEGLFDPERFEKDDVYRLTLSNLNLVSYLVSHGDAHRGQFVFVHSEPHLLSYSVDHSVAFLAVPNPMLLFRKDWSNIQVPSLSEDAIARLRAATEAELARLHTFSELALRDGVFVPTDIGPPFGDPDEVYRREGDRMQIGLRHAEIAGVAERIHDLLGEIDRGEIATH
jgi:hypothetical protein